MDVNYLMQLFNESGGVGVRLDGKPYPIRSGESPIKFFNRVMEEHSAWKAGQEATTPSADKDDEVRPGEPREDKRPGPTRGSNEEDVSRGETSLEETLKSKVAALRRSREARARALTDAIEHEDRCRIALKECERELRHAERFLSELSSEVRNETSEDIPDKEKARPRQRRRVGKKGSAVESKGRSKGGDSSYKSDASD